MYQTFDAEDLSECMGTYAHEIVGFHPQYWLKDHRNIALTDGEGNYNLFEFFRNGIYYGHTFYSNARGKRAIRVGQEALDWAFSPASPISVIQGLTPMTKPAARWFNRKLGFESHGIIYTPSGPCELFILDRRTYTLKG